MLLVCCIKELSVYAVRWTYADETTIGGIIKSNHSYPQVILVDFPSLPFSTDDRASKLAEHGQCT